MKKRVLISSFDMAVGGVERSLIGLLSSIDYDQYDVDLMLYRHEGEFLPLLPPGPRLLPEVPQYSTFRKPIKQILKEGHKSIVVTRLMARQLAGLYGKWKRCAEPGYMAIQYGWALSTPFLPELEGEYDAAVSFLWPHYFVGRKVRAKKKIGWIHTDYSNISVNKELDNRMWNEMHEIIAVSEDCKRSFLSAFPGHEQKTKVIENIISPEFVREQSEVDVQSEMPSHTKRIKLVTVGRLTYAKGLDDAVRACKVLVDMGCNIEWYVIGYGPLEGELKGLIEQLGVQDRFILLGKKINPYPYIQAGDIYVQPSRYEGKAVTVREAQILGKPVLITNFPTAQSQVREGIDGFITPLGVDGIVAGIQRLLDDPALAQQLASNAKNTDYGNGSEIDKLYSLIG